MKFKQALSIIYPVILLIIIPWMFLKQYLEDEYLYYDCEIENGGVFQVFYSKNGAFSEKKSIKKTDLKRGQFKGKIKITGDNFGLLRVDPTHNDHTVNLKQLGWKKRGHLKSFSLLENQRLVQNQIESIQFDPIKDTLTIVPVPGATDPNLAIRMDHYQTYNKQFDYFVITFLSGLFLTILYTLFWRREAYNQLNTGIIQAILNSRNNIVKSNDFLSQTANNHRLISVLCILLISALYVFSRFCFQAPIESGGDEVHKWFFSKLLLGHYSMDYWIMDHHTARWALMIPIVIFQFFFGIEPEMFLLLPFLTQWFVHIVMFLVGEKLYGKTVSAIASMYLITTNPGEFYQINPSVFLTAYVILSTYLFLQIDKHFEKTKQVRFWNVMFLSVTVFASYMTWIGGLFFFVPIPFLMLKRYGWKPALWFVGALFVFYSIETLAYIVTSEHKLGRLSMIITGHLGTSWEQMKLNEFFKRYFIIDPTFQKIVFASIIFSFITIFTQKKQGYQKFAVALILLSYLSIKTFFIKSIDPLEFMIDPEPRFFNSPAPLILILFFGNIKEMIVWIYRKIPKQLRSFTPLYVLSIVFVFSVYSFAENKQKYINENGVIETLKELKTYKAYAELVDKLEIVVIETDEEYPKGLKYYQNALHMPDTPNDFPHEETFKLGERRASVVLPPNLRKQFETNSQLRGFYKRNLGLYVKQLPFDAIFGPLSGICDGWNRAQIRAYLQLFDREVSWVLRDPELTVPGTPIEFETQQNTGKISMTAGFSVPEEVDLIRIPIQGYLDDKIQLNILDSSGQELLFSLRNSYSELPTWYYIDVPSDALMGHQKLLLKLNAKGEENHLPFSVGNPELILKGEPNTYINETK